MWVCGFVQFADRGCAEEALHMLNGTQLGGQNIRLSWGRSPSNKQSQVDPNQWNGGGYYGYGQGYETYGYALPKILIFTMEATLVMETTPKTSSYINNHASDLLVSGQLQDGVAAILDLDVQIS